MTELCRRALAAAAKADAMYPPDLKAGKSGYHDCKWQKIFDEEMAKTTPHYRNEEIWKAVSIQDLRHAKYERLSI